ncbi:MAG: hypothetical protein K2X77_24270 [Candidatus Obscuribacterales bacterium]|jgi:hypothetical protein|nr:hypothetical protein [Candidatus Obscuribacterales bacterium]
MKEIANLTDFLLALECAIFAFLLWHGGTGKMWTLMFGALAAASFAGGITHTFYEAPGTIEHLIWWDATLLCLGLTSIFLFSIALALWKCSSKGSLEVDSAGKPSVAIAVSSIVFVAYAVFVLTGLRPFLTAIVMYLPASIFLLVSIIRLSSTNLVDFKHTSICGILGMALTFIAAGLQQAKVEVPALMLNYNALYHIIQGIGLCLLFLYGGRIQGAGNKS